MYRRRWLWWYLLASPYRGGIDMRSNSDAPSAETMGPTGRASRPLFFDTHLPPPSRLTPPSLPPSNLPRFRPPRPSSAPNPAPAPATLVVPQRISDGGRLTIPRSFPVAWCSLLFAGCLSLSPPAGTTTFRVPGEFVTTRYSAPQSTTSGPTEFPVPRSGMRLRRTRVRPRPMPGSRRGHRPRHRSRPTRSGQVSRYVRHGSRRCGDQTRGAIVAGESGESRTLVAPNFGDGGIQKVQTTRRSLDPN